MMSIFQDLVIAGVGFAVAAYGYTQAQDEAWDGHDQSTVEIIAASLNETGLTDDEGYWDGEGYWHYS